MNQLQLVNYNQAVILKKDGFNYPCRLAYSVTGGSISTCPGKDVDWNAEGIFSRPPISLALQFYREVKKVHCGVGVRTGRNSNGETGILTGYNFVFAYDKTQLISKMFLSYPEAESALLDEIQKLKFD